MITKKDNLLIRPWQERRYESHRQKVNSALPVIDARPPPFRGHVCSKLKKKQTEKERCIQIERDNLRLLQKMESIMKRNRLDNHWTRPQPTFLQRISLYQPSTENSSTYSKFDGLASLSNSSNNLNSSERPITSRKERCAACYPQLESEFTYEERLLPWEQEMYNRIRHYENYDQKIPKIEPHMCSATRPQTMSNKSSANSHAHLRPLSKAPAATQRLANRQKAPTSTNTMTTTTTSLILSRGNLNLAVNFPPDTQVLLRDGDCEKVILKKLCKCKNVPLK